jgi:hypothetical protein
MPNHAIVHVRRRTRIRRIVPIPPLPGSLWGILRLDDLESNGVESITAEENAGTT